jgi:beta-mannosidase
MREHDLSQGWSVLQDVRDLGEELSIYKDDFDPAAVAGGGFSEWMPLDHPGHLQLLFSQQPYFGRELRWFNEHAWWYRLDFFLPDAEATQHARLRFEGVDYFCKVWLNGQCMGEHEGYFAPFEFEVGALLKAAGANHLVVKVWAPWDHEYLPGRADLSFLTVVRDMVKGTCEHDDTFVQRDVNPVGMWGRVSLRTHSGICFAGNLAIDSTLDAEAQHATVQVRCPVIVREGSRSVQVRCRVLEEGSGRVAATATQSHTLADGETSLNLQLDIAQPRLWWTWDRCDPADRGEPALYRAVVEIEEQGRLIERRAARFGVRSIALRRSEQETTFLLNGQPVFLRGTTYFPEVYQSAVDAARYERDLKAIRQAGCNAVRIHVHVESPAFYDLCDELGIAVIQDSDLNWVHPGDEAWAARAVRVFGDMIRHLYNHPAIIAWICFNEPDGYSQGSLLNVCPGPQLAAEAQRLDPGRPIIKGSGCWDDPESGDSHNYKGSLNGEHTHYTDVYGDTEKLNTEFGFDAPPVAHNLRQVPALYERLKSIVPAIPGLQRYQYRLIKYFVEHYRIAKYRPCSGYFQFMFIDLCPQSFYGVYDWWGVPKEGLRALEESNQPLAVIMEHKDGPVAIWAVNDRAVAFPGCTVSWTAVDELGAPVASGCQRIDLEADTALRVTDLAFGVQPDMAYRVSLTLCDRDGRVLAANVYRDPFHHPPHPRGHPQRMSHELGMRLYWA